MQYRILGKTKEKVSTLGFGCMRFPLLSDGKNDHIDEEQSELLIRRAIQLGIDYFDTAYPYHAGEAGGAGQSEPFLGRVLAKDGLRNRVKIASKLPSWLISTRDDMDRLLDEQLKRLQTDHIDFYLIHTLNEKLWENMQQNHVASFLDSALRDGRIRHAGFSFHDRQEIFPGIVDGYDWSFCQIQYNYLDENYQAGTEGLRYAAERGLGVIVMEPLRGGKLAGQIIPEAKAGFDAVHPEWSAAEWALRWVWDHPEVGMLLSGMNSLAQVEENVRIADHAAANHMNADELQAVESAAQKYHEKMPIPCTACAYCMPCPAGVAIPNNFEQYNNTFMFDVDPAYGDMEKAVRASNCVECGRCEPLCPQGIAIIEQLKAVDALLG